MSGLSLTRTASNVSKDHDSSVIFIDSPNGHITITVTQASGGRARLLIDAPRHYEIFRADASLKTA